MAVSAESIKLANSLVTREGVPEDDYLESEPLSMEELTTQRVSTVVLNERLEMLQSLPLEQRIVVIEKISSSYRLEKIAQAIKWLRQIIECRLAYNEYWLTNLRAGHLTPADYFEVFFCLTKFNKATRDRIIDDQQHRIYDILELHIVDYQNMLTKFQLDNEFCLESIYFTCVDTMGNMDLSRTNQFRNPANSEYRYLKMIVAIINKFTSVEFKIFRAEVLANIKQVPSNDYGQNYNIKMINPKKIEDCKRKLENLNKLCAAHTKDLAELQENIFKNTADIAVELSQLNDAVWIEFDNMRQLLPQRTISTDQADPDIFDFSINSSYPKVRANFKRLYNIDKALDKLIVWLQKIIQEKQQLQPRHAAQLQVQVLAAKAKARAANRAKCWSQNPDDWIVVEEIPEIPEEDALYARTLQVADSDNLEENIKLFYAKKQEQLLQWQKQIVERRAQRNTETKSIMRIYTSPIQHGTEMLPEAADYLAKSYDGLDGVTKELFQSLFEHGTKAHNFRFEQILLLIAKFNGKTRSNDGSHFAILLPKTFSVGLEVVTAGGSYRPHDGDEWNLDAHYLCRDAFINAGITPERIATARLHLMAAAKTKTLKPK